MSPAEIRAVALSAACAWLAGVDPFPQGRQLILESAEEFAGWIANDSGVIRADGSGLAAESPAAANPGPSGTQGLDRTNESTGGVRL